MMDTENLSPPSVNISEKIWPTINSPYINAYEFEVFDISKARQMMSDFRPVTVGICCLYVVFAFTGQSWMKSRQPFSLRKTLVVWNSLLAIFSIVGFIRTFPEFYYILTGSDGFHNSCCSNNIHNYATAFWALVFVLSKVVELGDTAFIVLRKQKLIFLHWYHHISVLMLTWIYYVDYEPAYRWMGMMNYGVHSLMYSYFALKSLKVKIPRNFSMMVTILQISQMIVGFYINMYTLSVKRNGKPCERSMGNVYLGLCIYSSYFILFLHFFIKAYFVKPKPKTA